MCIICSRGVLLSVLLVVSFFVVSLPGMFLSLATCDLATTCDGFVFGCFFNDHTVHTVSGIISRQRWLHSRLVLIFCE